MIETDAARLRDAFLAQLDAAMRGLPHGVASEIRGGIAEELEGLDAAATAERIAQLGDPAAIAREAQAEVPGAPGAVFAPVASVPPAVRTPTLDTRGFAVTAALVLSFGGFVVPFVGWVVGAVLVCLSTLWRTGEKVLAILVPFVCAGISIFVASTFWTLTTVIDSGSAEGVGPSEVANPLLPAWYDFGWMALMLLGLLLVPASGLWLLWRLRGRTSR